MAPKPPIGSGDPAQGVRELDAENGRRNRRTRQYSDGFAPIDMGVTAEEPASQLDGLPRVRIRPKSDTVTELLQDRAAVALPELSDHLVVADAVAPKPGEAALRSHGSGDEWATLSENRPITKVAVPHQPAADEPTARDLPVVRLRSNWNGPATLLAAALAGGAAAWVAFGRAPAAQPATQTPQPPDASALAAPVAQPVAKNAEPQPLVVVGRQPPAATVPVAAASPAPQPPTLSESHFRAAPTVAAAPAVGTDPALADCAAFDQTVAGTRADPVAPYLALRRAPDETSGKIAQLPDGTRLRVLGSHGRWRRVVVCNGLTGWVHGRWIAPKAGGGP